MKKAFFAVLLAVMFYGCDYEMLPPNNIVSPYLCDLSFIPKPKKNAAPLPEFETPEYVGTIVWKRNNITKVEGKFPEEGVAYTAEVFLTPKRNYTFKGFSGTFFHREAQSTLQEIYSSPDSAVVEIDFGRLPFSGADFISLTGTRLKTFRMTPDTSQLQLTYYFKFSGSGSFYGWHSVQIGPDSWRDEKDTDRSFFTNDILFSAPLAAIFSPDDYNVSISGQIFYYRDMGSFTKATYYYTSFNNTATAPFTKGVSVDVNTFEHEPFSCESYTLPEKGYIADRNYFDYREVSVPFALSPEQAAQTSGISGQYYQHINLTWNFNYVLTFRQVSRDFYLYRDVSITYDPAVQIVGWHSISPIIDRFEMDESANTLKVYFKDYTANTTGEVLYLFIISEDGVMHTKFVSIGD